MTDGELSRKFLIDKVFEVAEVYVDENKKGWRVKMPEFHDAMDDLGFGSRDVRGALALLASRMYVIVFPDEDGHVAGISLVPQRYRCENCNLLLDMQDDPEDHIDLCLRQQKKIERNRMLR